MRGQNRRGRNTRMDHDALIEDDIDDYLALSAPTSRRGLRSITHLIGFHAPLSVDTEPEVRRNRHSKTGSSRWRYLDNARYVHANYRFIVRPDDDYHKHARDPDAHLDWEQVLQVLVSSHSQLASCLICLDIPVAPRMTKCGHIFCLPCLIHYMEPPETKDGGEVAKKASKIQYKNCPICSEPLCLPDSRPVRWHAAADEPGSPLVAGSNMTLRLMKRLTKGTLSLPSDGSAEWAMDRPFPWHFTPEALDYARIILGTKEYMEEQFDLDVATLHIQAEEDAARFGNENKKWVDRAVEDIKRSKRAVRAIGSLEEILPKMTAAMEINGDGADATTQNGVPEPSGDSEKVSAKQAAPAAKPPSFYYFYQGLLHLYLSPLDIRILRTAFGDYSHFPDKITPRAEHIVTGCIVDDELRKRARYLAHLPEGCEVTFLECDFTGIVSDEVLKRFAPELNRRRKLHREKTAREDRSRAQAELLEREAQLSEMGTRRGPWAGSGEEQRPRMDSDDFVPLPSRSVAVGAVQGTGAGIEDGDALTSGSASASMSHPQLHGSAVGDNGTGHNSSSSKVVRTVWGTTAVASADNGNGPLTNGNGHGFGYGYDYGYELDGVDGRAGRWAGGWDDDAAARAIASATGKDDQADSSAGAGAGGGGKRKTNRKNRNITLMSTSVRRAA